MMMGHGSPMGLFSVGQFPETYNFIIDGHTVQYLQGKECMFIWCNADKFVERNKLNGLYTGMFISEVGESIMCGVSSNQNTVDTSNDSFAQILGNQLLTENNYLYIHKQVNKEYSIIANSNNVAQYNLERWYCRFNKNIGKQLCLEY